MHPGVFCNLQQLSSLTLAFLRKGNRNANGANVAALIASTLKSIVKEQTEKMEELRIPYIILSTKDDVLPLIGEAKYKVVF